MRLPSALAASVVALLVLLCCGAPAVAASDRLGLSWDGATWSSELTGTLFDRAGSIPTWVPGDTDTQHFYVRNQGGDPAALAIEYALPPNDLVDSGDFALTASVDGGAPVTLTPGSGWLPLDAGTLADGHHADVAVTGTFRWSSDNRSMDEAFPVDFRVTLTELASPTGGPGGPEATATAGAPDAAGGPGVPGAPSADHVHGPNAPAGVEAGPLPGTGAPEIRWALGLGLFALGGGAAVVVLSRRKGRDGETS